MNAWLETFTTLRMGRRCPMFGALSSILDFVIIALCWITLALAVVIYRGRGSRTFLFISLFALVTLLIELELRISETGSSVSLWIGAVFESLSVVVFKSALYAALAFLLLLILFRILEKKIPVGWIVFAAAVALWQLIFPLRRIWTGATALLYLLPFQTYVIILAMYGLKELKSLPPRSHFPMVRGLLVCAIVMMLLTIAEDFLTIIPYGFSTDLSLEATKEMKSRNFCENILDILLLSSMSFAGGKILHGALSTEPSDAPVQSPKDINAAADRFAESIGLSNREREVLPLLLENKSNQEISEALFISPGTVKSHTHNIYQKAGVTDRSELLRKASALSDMEE